MVLEALDDGFGAQHVEAGFYARHDDLEVGVVRGEDGDDVAALHVRDGGLEGVRIEVDVIRR